LITCVRARAVGAFGLCADDRAGIVVDSRTQTRVFVVGDDDVIENRDANEVRDLQHAFRQATVGIARLRLARRVIVARIRAAALLRSANINCESRPGRIGPSRRSSKVSIEDRC
jgi:hypothetical protein